MDNNIIYTTTNNIDGYYVEKYLGVITKEVVFRNGLASTLSAAIVNFTSSFNLRDVELPGSTYLIENAKKYLMEQFEHEVCSKGANAVLGIDFETTFGVEIVKVSLNGTAVKIAPKADNPEGADLTGSTSSDFTVKACNVVDSFIPLKIFLSPSFDRASISLMVLKKNDSVIQDLLCDVIFHTRFRKDYKAEDVYFLDFANNKSRTTSCEPISIDLPSSIYKTLENVTLIVKQAYCDGNLTSYPLEPLSDIEGALSEEHENAKQLDFENRNAYLPSVSLQDYYKEISSYETVEELLVHIRLASTFLNREEYEYFIDKVYEVAGRDGSKASNVHLLRQTIRRAFTEAINLSGGLEPIDIGDSSIECPICGAKQRENRNICLKCSLRFKRETSWVSLKI